MKKKIRFCIVLFMTITTGHAFSQPYYFFTNYTSDNGLSSQKVNCIIKDNDGFLWVGTAAGLYRFNGYDFTVYKSLSGDSTSIASNYIVHLYQDREGRLWISTSGGTCVYEKKRNQFRRISFTRENGYIQNSYMCVFVLEDSGKNIWAGCDGGGLLQFDPGKNTFRNFLPQPLKQADTTSSFPTFIVGMLEDEDHTFWMIGYRKVLHLNGEKKIIQSFETHAPGNTSTFKAMNLTADLNEKNFLWIGTWGSGLVHFNKLTGEFQTYRFETTEPVNLRNIVFDVHRHNQNKLWLATNRGIVVFDTEKKAFDGFIRDEFNEKTVVNIETYKITEDADGIIWIGTVSGLSNINPSKQNFVKDPVWNNVTTQKFYADEKSGKIYGIRFYNNRSLVIYDPESKSQTEFHIPDADKLSAEPFAIIKDSRGLVWIGTTRGIYTFSEAERKFTLLDIHSQLDIPDRNVYINDIIEDASGNIWFSNYRNDLIKFNFKNRKLELVSYPLAGKKESPLSNIISMTRGHGNDILITTEYSGVLKLDPDKNKFELFSTADKKYSGLYRATGTVAGKDDELWVSTANSGLVCIDKNGNSTSYIRDDFGNIIDEQQGIERDNSGKIWLVASNGLYRFDPSTRSFTHFSMEDGLPANAIGSALCRLRDGSIGFIHQNFLFQFHPDQLSKKEIRLPVHLTSFSMNGKVSPFSSFVDELDTIVLTHSENSLTLEFSALNFNNPSSTRYSYMLEGVDKNWSHPERNRSVNFSQLAPGNYTLRIRAGISDHYDMSGVKKIFIQIVPAWWQTSLFKWICILAAVYILFALIRFFLALRFRQQIAKLEQQRQIENIRMRISRDIHDEIGSGLTKIKLMSRNLSKASQDKGGPKEVFGKISSAADELIQNLGEIVWTINPANDTLENIFAFIRSYLSKLFEENPDLSLLLDFPEPKDIPKGVLVNPEVKRNLLLILKESVTNILKHAQATEVKVFLRSGHQSIEMSISDNGKGIKNENAFGNGIKNMRKRAETMHAELEFNSSAEGTQIRIIIPDFSS